MNRARFIDVLRDLFEILPHWSWPLAIVALAALFWLTWGRGIRVRQVKGRIRAAVRAAPEERDARVEQAFRIAAGRPLLLRAIAEEAAQFHLDAVRRRALAGLESQGAFAVRDAILAREQKGRPTNAPRHPVEEATSIRRMLDGGAVERARERMDRARAAFPEDADLRALEAELAEHERRAREDAARDEALRAQPWQDCEGEVPPDPPGAGAGAVPPDADAV